jgi:nitrite reductase (cytochrome c-552)
MKRTGGFWGLAVLFVIAVGVTIGISMLRTNIMTKKLEARQYPLMLVKLSDDDVDPITWGKSFPSQFESYI